MIHVQHVTYDYPGHRALDDVGFELPPSSVTALVGPNGAGKTTLLRSMAALDEPMDGQIFINGLDVWESPRLAHRFMGYLPDHFGLYPELSAWRCLLYAALARGLDEEEAKVSAQWAAERVGLSPQLKMRAGTLSRGQRQRLALAQTIVHRPKVLLLDEPASGLDPEARVDLSNLVKSLAASGMTLLISSHILAELEDYCTGMLVLEQGRLLAYRRLHETVAESTRQNRLLRIRLAANENSREGRDLPALQAWASARGWDARQDAGETTLLLKGDFDDAAQLKLLRDLLADGWAVLEFAGQTHNLQDVYLETVNQQEKSA